MVAEFFNMGGYGVYIWPGYAVVLAVLIVLGIQSRKWLLRLEKAVEDLNPEISEPPQTSEGTRP